MKDEIGQTSIFQAVQSGNHPFVDDVLTWEPETGWESDAEWEKETSSLISKQERLRTGNLVTSIELDHSGSSPLSIAMEKQDETMFWKVWDRSKRLGILAKDCEIALMQHICKAIQSPFFDIVADRFNEWQALDEDGRSLMHLAVLTGNQEIALKLLYRTTQNLNVKDREGLTALDIALQNGLGVIAAELERRI